ncbi:MAG: isoprenoid biosynthesis glyoxalase ElbB [Phycisphaerales bacterium]|nr:isoprenoid biosynthesis glyoxalase ElbB [Phycisphaerales bacterium]
MSTVAVVLSGCGFLDGSEIHESVSCLIHLARHGIEYRCFAPDVAQADVVNHATQKPAPEARNCLVEAGRIARGQIMPLAELHVQKFAGVVFPGGFGAAKNLCTFAKDGPACSVLPDVERVVKEFAAASRPIAMCCIAPVIAARVLGTAAGGRGCSVTIGSDTQTASAIQKMGASHVATNVTGAHVDEANRLVTTGAYMFHASPWDVFQGIGAMIDRFATMVAK